MVFNKVVDRPPAGSLYLGPRVETVILDIRYSLKFKFGLSEMQRGGRQGPAGRYAPLSLLYSSGPTRPAISKPMMRTM